MTQHDLPKISIVIPNLNGGDFIEEALLSILEQGYPRSEIIIIDGGSTDHSVEIIKKYEPQLKYWVSEPDRGQAHAINKGLRHAIGELFDWTNSDDRIAPGTFWKVAKAFEEYPEAYAVCGYMTYFGGGHYQKPVRMTVFDKLEKTLVYGSLSGPSMYFRLNKFRELGELDERLHYCFDLEFWYRFIEKYGVGRLQFIDGNLSFFRLHPDSKTVGQLIKFGEEQYIIHRSVIQSFGQIAVPLIPIESLNITSAYQRDWDFPNLNPTSFVALAMQQHLERMHVCLSFLSILKWFLISFKLSPLQRNWRFYLLPLRAIRWKIITSSFVAKQEKLRRMFSPFHLT